MLRVKSPGVYIRELDAFSNAVVPVPTAIPVFVGYTETALRGAQDLTGIPTQVSILDEFESLFGVPPRSQMRFERNERTFPLTPEKSRN